jgi:hypothetical protein
LGSSIGRSNEDEDIYYTTVKLDTLRRNLQNIKDGEHIVGLIDHLKTSRNIALHRQRFYAGHSITALKALEEAGIRPTGPLSRQDVESVLQDF